MTVTLRGDAEMKGAQKGKSFSFFSVAVPDSKRSELDVDTTVDSLELT